jgi:hypothetical protein
MLLHGVSPTEALNCEPEFMGQADGDLPAQLNQSVKRFKRYITAGRVNYHDLAVSEDFQHYCEVVQRLRTFDLGSLGDDAERMAFWIKLYNALVIHAAVAYRVQGSITEAPGVFDRAAYVIGRLRFSANDIEHGILRANAGHPALPGPQFAQHDPRVAFAVSRLDPRIHFTLVCAARSCPPIGFYDATRLNMQLDLVARNFVYHGGVVVRREQMTLYLSQLFSWYAPDFGGRWFGYRRQADLLRFVAQYLADPDDRLWVAERARLLRVKYLAYDWALNV